ncbi:NTP transferase domain-containing protein [Vibrio parahaemolyticus]|nr:NTP transferase domain-containing protein [Vibrio parahaemolyticus]MDN4716979.1 NTP transferase domain-containing protein [Vibrio parahaemolyticus]MDN4722339.1 NTP transferase domain-containing protein [Vibrio parahaemolyticus]MDN4724403.1 NTP transferase domain-containing protein [Vibrio parahaemolyticus]MDN4730272.1 NTP transferase domain-containing protein [Vibrio parahaemolyticus]
MDVVAVIVARGGSKRIPNKNILPINGVSLLERKIDTLKQCPSISRVVVGSEDVTILELAKARGVEVVKRPDYYCDEARASANDMIGNMCSLISADVVVWAHCTNPLVSVDTYESAVNAFLRLNKKGTTLCYRYMN